MCLLVGPTDPKVKKVEKRTRILGISGRSGETTTISPLQLRSDRVSTPTQVVSTNEHNTYSARLLG